MFKQLLSGIALLSLGGLICRGCLLVAFVMAARELGVVQYGELAIIRSTVNTFMIFAGFGMGITATKYVAELKASSPRRTGDIIVLTLVFATLTATLIGSMGYISSAWIATSVLELPQLESTIQLATALLSISAINGAIAGTFIGFKVYGRASFIQVVNGIASLACIVSGAHLGGVDGVMAGMLSASVITLSLSIHLLIKTTNENGVYLRGLTWWREKKVLLTFSLPAVLGSAFVTPALWYCNVMLTRSENGVQQMAYFDVAYQWYLIVLFAPSIAGKVLLPAISEAVGLNDRASYKSAITYSLIINSTVAFVIAAGISMLASTILRQYGTDFEQGATTMLIMLSAAVLVSINGIVGQLLAANDRMWHGLALNGAWAFAMVGSAYYFISNSFGAQGLAFAYLLSYSIHTCIQIIYVKLSIKPDDTPSKGARIEHEKRR